MNLREMLVLVVSPETKYNCLCFMYEERPVELASSLVDILNQQLKMYNSLSQAQSDTKMVQSLVAIWEVHPNFLSFILLSYFYGLPLPNLVIVFSGGV